MKLLDDGYGEIIGNCLVGNGDCFEMMKFIPDGYCDAILTDPPYGITQNNWDKIPELDKMWKEFHRIVKEDGAIIITASQPFSSQLVMSNAKNFKYEVIWEKTISSGQLNVKRQPLRSHETVLIFYKKQPTYNEQKEKGKPYSINRKINFDGYGYGKQKNNSKNNDGFRHARSVIKISNPRVTSGHPTQKPVELMEYFIKTFTNEKEVIIDPFMGSGTTGVACKNLNRYFIGMELDKKYYEKAKERFK